MHLIESSDNSQKGVRSVNFDDIRKHIVDMRHCSLHFIGAPSRFLLSETCSFHYVWYGRILTESHDRRWILSSRVSRCKGIQNKACILESIYYTFMVDKEKQLKLFLYVIVSITLNLGFCGGTTNSRTICNFIASCFKHVLCHRSHIVIYFSFDMLNVMEFDLVYDIVYIIP